MPRRKKTDILNYKIYKIASLDPKVKDIYIGSTADLKQRKIHHKSSCNNENNKTKVYQYIRDNGGWENFKVYVVEELKCNEYQAELREEYYRIELNATLNSKMCCNFDGTPQEKKEHIKEQQKKHRENNKEAYKEKKRIYRDNHKQEIKEYSKVYRDNHKQEINEYQKVSREIQIQKLWRENDRFIKNRQATIHRLIAGLNVKDSTLQKYEIHLEDFNSTNFIVF